MKIAQVVCVYPPYRGGIGTSALETARVLSSAGHKVETFTINSGARGNKNITHPVHPGGGHPSQEGVFRLRAFPKIGNGGFLPQLFWRLKKFDLVYLNYPFFGAAEIIWFLKKFFWKNKTRLIIRFHMEPEFSSVLSKILSLPSRLIAPSLFKEADLIICASRDYAEASLPPEILAANKNKISEIPYGVDTEKFKPYFCHPEAEPKDLKHNKVLISSRTTDPSPGAQYDKKVAARDDFFRIIFVGGLDRAHYFKGISVLFDSLSLLDKDNKNWRLEIVGDGDLRPQYEKRARELGLADKIIFSGKVSDEELPKKYQEAYCLVLPSVNRGEAFGIVLLEAMATGVPVIASSLPGVKKVFTDGREGLLVRPGDAYDLKEKIEFLMENSVRRAEMGRAARKLAEEKYDRRKIDQRFIEEIERMQTIN